jgi:hypothetical protein
MFSAKTVYYMLRNRTCTALTARQAQAPLRMTDLGVVVLSHSVSELQEKASAGKELNEFSLPCRLSALKEQACQVWC